jgi:tetratricopeptide (TPR) repeat protein
MTTKHISQATTLKDQGNKAFAAKRYDEAIDLFTQAIALDPSNHVLYSNRSAANAGKKMWTEALADAEEVCASGWCLIPVFNLYHTVYQIKSDLGERLCEERRCSTWCPSLGRGDCSV